MPLVFAHTAVTHSIRIFHPTECSNSTVPLTYLITNTHCTAIADYVRQDLPCSHTIEDIQYETPLKRSGQNTTEAGRVEWDPTAAHDFQTKHWCSPSTSFCTTCHRAVACHNVGNLEPSSYQWCIHPNRLQIHWTTICHHTKEMNRVTCNYSVSFPLHIMALH